MRNKIIEHTLEINNKWAYETSHRSSQVKSSQLYLGRLALSAIGWYQTGPCVNYDYTIKIQKLKITLKLRTRILKSE